MTLPGSLLPLHCETKIQNKHEKGTNGALFNLGRVMSRRHRKNRLPVEAKPGGEIYRLEAIFRQIARQRRRNATSGENRPSERHPGESWGLLVVRHHPLCYNWTVPRGHRNLDPLPVVKVVFGLPGSQCSSLRVLQPSD